MMSAVKRMCSDEIVHDPSASSKVEKKENVIDSGDPSDDASDRDHFSHQYKDKI